MLKTLVRILIGIIVTPLIILFFGIIGGGAITYLLVEYGDIENPFIIFAVGTVCIIGLELCWLSLFIPFK